MHNKHTLTHNTKDRDIINKTWFSFLSSSGWDEGCLTMCLGEIAKLTIPAEKGYGNSGFPAWGYPFRHYSL